MEIKEKHRLEILNAKRCFALKVDKLATKKKYGEDVSCCIEDLFFKKCIISRLECFNFDVAGEISVMDLNIMYELLDK